MKMTEHMKREWKHYRNECKENNVEPTGADFLDIERSDEELDESIVGRKNLVMSWSYLLAKKQPLKAMAATA